MKLEQDSYSIDRVIHLNDEYLNNIQCNEEITPINENTVGGILSDIRYSWLARGPKLQILHTKSGSKVAAWCFRAQHDFYTAVTCVVDLATGNGRAPLLVVGLECEITGGMVCVFDVGSSRVVRAIQINDKVTSIEVVNGGCDNSLPGVLRALDGLIAVGTAKGKVFLVDLCRQICEEAIGNSGDSIKDEINSCHLLPLAFDDLRNLESHKEMSLNNGDHLCLQLNENSTSSEHFTLYGPSGEIRLRANMSEVTISSLHFSPVLGALLVGYNFGAWQIYNLVSSPVPLLSYTSPMYEDCIPVAYFAVQEPCDDPRAFCYVWASYSVQDCNISDSVPSTSIAVMYALTYQSKEYLEGYGILYQDFTQCSVRFQLELGTVFPGKSQGAKCLGLRSYTKPTVDVAEERLAICTVLWARWDAANIGGLSEIYLAVFDLNQWYKEQMPAQPRAQNEQYMVCVSLTELMANNGAQLVSADDLLDFCLDPQSLCPFLCPQRLEEHYYPSALAFRALGLFCRQLTWVRSAGSQRHLLSQLELAGPLCLLQPRDLYYRCVALGLCPSYCDLQPSPTALQQRVFVLSVALEHQLVSWLCRCARDWANGAQAVSGCTLDMLLNWGWQRANTLKFNADKLCVSLFDHTGQKLDQNALLHLNHSACQLKHLTTLFETVLTFCHIYFPPEDIEDIRYQLNSLQMISIYLEVLQWLLNVGLLPECPLSMYPLPDESERMSAPYPVESLARFYTERRAELSDDGASLLFIDQLVRKEFEGGMLSKQWECDGGNGLYPPPSLQALLRTYLVENIDITHKHCLFIYVFLDLAMTLDQSRYKSIITHLIKFPAVFKLSPSIIKMTQAFWQLDHGDFSTAMSQLLDPAVNSDDLKPWHHRTVLKALLLQGQHQHALLYQQVRKPPISSVQDICIVITLLIVNDLLQEAFHFQRENTSVYNEKEILKHFFSVSEKMNQLPNILHLPLSPSEEEMLVAYLKNIPCETNDTYLVIYYLLRNRYNEAFAVHDDQQHGVKQGLLGQQDRNFRSVMVSGFKKTLPNVTQLLLDIVKKDKKQKECWKIVERPQPMSVFIHDTQEKAKYKSSLIEASFQKVKEIWAEVDGDTPFISTPKTPNGKRNESVLIYANVMQPDVDSSEDLDIISEATPAKRMRLSPRHPISYKPQRLSGVDSSSLLDTPIVKRKSYRGQTDVGPCHTPVVGTRTSILKVRSFIRNSISPDVQTGNDDRGTSTTPEVLDGDLEDQETTPLTQNISIKSFAVNLLSAQRHRSPLGLSPRRSLQRTPRPAVHFEDVTSRPNSCSSEGSNETSDNNHLSVRIDVHREQTPELPSSKDSTRSTEDVFYSPNSSFSSSDIKTTNSVDTEMETVSGEIETSDQIEENYINERKISLKRKANDSSVKSRRSYKSTTPIKVDVATNQTSSQNLVASAVVETPQGLVISSKRSTTSRRTIASSAAAASPSLVPFTRSTASKTLTAIPSTVIIASPSHTAASRKSTVGVASSDPVINSPKPLVSSRKSIATKISTPVVAIASSATPRKSSTRISTAKVSEASSKAPPIVPVSPRRSTRSKSMEPSSKPTIISSDSTPNKKELFPKVGGRRSLSRQVLEHNTITKALQRPITSTRISLAKIPVLENINSQTTAVQVSYSKTVTSIVKKSSDTITEETCDKSSLALKNIFINEKDCGDNAPPIIKHVHNESSSKSSVKKVTEILEDSDEDTKSDHVLSFNSDKDDSLQLQRNTNRGQKEQKKELQKKQQQDEEQKKNQRMEENMDVSMEDDINKKQLSNETTFEDTENIIEITDSSVDTKSDYHVLSFTSEIDDSFQLYHEKNSVRSTEENKEQNEQKEEMQTKQQQDENQEKNQQENVEQRMEEEEIITEKNMDVSMEDEINRKPVSNETSFEDISSIIDSEETESSESDPDVMNISEPIPTSEPNIKVIREEKVDEDETIAEEDSKHSSENSAEERETLAADKDSQHSSESSDDAKPLQEDSSESSEDVDKQLEEITAEEDSKQSSQSSEDAEKNSNLSENSNENVEIIESSPREGRAASEEIEEEINVDEVDEERENLLVPSDDETSEDEKISNEENEEEQEEAEEEQSEVEEEQSAEETDNNDSKSLNSSRSSDVIEINSSSSLEVITLNQSEDPEENQDNDEENILEQNITTAEKVVEDDEQMQQITLNQSEDLEENHHKDEEQNIVTVEKVIEDDEQMQQIEEQKDNKIENTDVEMSINDMQTVCEEMRQVEDEMQQMEEEIEKMEVIQAIAMEQDAAEDAAELTRVQTIPPDIVEQETEQVAQEPQQQNEQVVQDVSLENIIIPKNIRLEIEEKAVPEDSVSSSKDTSAAVCSEPSTSQDCLETIKFPQSELQEDLEQTDILCSDSFAKETKVEPLIQKEESYTPGRRSKRIHSKQQETKDPLESVIATRTRKHSVSIEPEKSPLKENLKSTDTTRKQNIVVEVAKSTSSEPLQEEETLKPVRTRRRSTSVNSEILQEEETSKPIRPSTRRRSTSVRSEIVQDEELSKPVRTSTRQRSTSVSSEIIQEEKETSKPVRPSTRRRSTGVSSEIVQEEEISNLVRPSTRRRSSSIVSTEEPVPRATRATRSSSVDVEESKPSTRKRSTSVDAEEIKSIPHTTRRTRKNSEDEDIKEDVLRRSTRTSSVINLPVIAEEVNTRRTRASSITSQNSSTKSPARRGRKRSIQSDTIDEELETVAEKIEEYSATHRLTRRQKMIMEKSLEIQERKKLEVSEFDPIKLLDKKDFTGSPDLEERHYRGNSPASSIDTQSSVATRLTPEGTPKKTTRRRTSQGTTPDTPRRSSRHSRDNLDEICSVKSVPVVQLDRGDILRHRSLSPTAFKDSAPSPRSTRKSVRSSVLPKKIDLSKISEETDTKLSQESASQEKEKDRPKKSNKMDVVDSESRESVSSKASSTRRRTSYKPLAEYVPRFSAYKTRKSFKVRKSARSGHQ